MKPVFRAVLIFLGIIVLLLFLLYALRGVIVEPRLKSFLVSTIEARLGPRVSVGDISGSYLASLEVKDVKTLEKGTAGPVTVLEAQRIRLRYSLLSLLSGLDAFLGKLKVDLDGAVVELSLKGGGEEPPSPEDEAAPGPLELPSLLPEISVRESRVRVEGEGYSLLADGIRLFTRRERGRDLTAVEVGVREFLVVHPRVRERPVSLAASLTYDGRGLTIEGAGLPREELVRGGRVELAGLPRRLKADLRTVLFSRRLDVALVYDGGLLDAETQIEEFDLGDLFSVVLVPEIEIDGLLSTEAALRLDTRDLAGLEGDLSLHWKEGRVSTFSADSLEGRASAGEGRLLVERLEGKSKGNLVSVTDLGVSLEALLDGEWDGLVDSIRGGLFLHLEDVPGLLSQGGIPVPGVIKEVPAHRVSLEGGVGDRTLSLEEGRLEVEEALVELKPSSLTLPPAGDPPGKAAIHLDLLAAIPDLSVLTALLPLPPLEGDLKGEVFLDGNLDSLAGKVSVAARDLSVDGRRVEEVSLEGSADSSRMTVHTGSVRAGAGAGDLEVRDLSAASKALLDGEWRSLLAGMTGSLSLRSTDIPALMHLLEVPAPEESVPEHLLELEGGIGKGAVEVRKGSFESPPGKLVIERAKIVFPAEDLPWSGTAMEVTFDADVPDLEDAGRLFGFPDLAGSIGGRLEAAGTVDTLGGTVSLEGSGVAYRGFLLGEVSLKGSADRSRLRLDSLRVTREGALMTGTGVLDIPSRAVEDLALTLKVEDIAAFTGDLTATDHSGALEGEVNIAGTLASPEGSFHVTLRKGTFGEVEISEVSVKGGLSGSRMEIAEAAARTSEGSVSLAGGLEVEKDPRLYRLLLDDLSLAREELKLTLDGRAEAVYSPEEGLSVDSFYLAGPPGSIRLSGKMPREGDATLAMKISGLTGEGWIEEFVGDLFTFSGGDFAVQASGSLERPILAVTGTVAEFQGRGAPFPLSGEIDAGYSAEGVDIRTFSVSSPSGKAMDVTGTLPLDPLADNPLLPAEFVLTASLDIPDLREIAFLLPEGYEVDGRLEGEADLTGTWEDPTGNIHVKVSDLSLPEKLRPAPPGKLSADCRIEAVKGEFELRELRIDSPVISAKASGSWSGVPVLIDVARGEEELLQGDVSVEGRLEASAISWVSRGVDALRSADGALDVDFSLRGPVKDPEVTVEADLEDLGVRLRGAPTVSDVNGGLSLKDGILKIPGLEGDLGGAPFELSGTLAGIGGEELDFDLKLTGESLLLYRDEGVRVRADADLAARGPLSKLGVSGSVMITDSRYVKNIDLLGSVGGEKAPTVRRGGNIFSFRDPPLRDLVFDLRLGAKDPFVIRNQFIRGTVTPNLRLTGTGEEPALEGRVTIDEYRATLPTGSLRGEQGLVAFLEGEPARPWLEVLGEARMMGYDITMQITGFADEPKIVFSSSPPLPGDEVLLMVLAGTPPRSSDREVASSTGAALSLFLARSFLSRFFGGDPEATDEMLLDRLETQVGRDITEKGDPTIDITLQLKEQFLLKGGSLYLTGEKDRYDDSNYGVRFGLEFLNKGEK